jgi:hypothetical protein
MSSNYERPEVYQLASHFFDLASLELKSGPLPIASIELNGLYVRGSQIEIVQHSHVDGVELRCGARPGEDMDAARTAEVMLGHSRSELIRPEHVLARQQTKVLRRNAMMDDTLLRADRAVADGDAIDGGIDFEAHRLAMTASVIGRHDDLRLGGLIQAHIEALVDLPLVLGTKDRQPADFRGAADVCAAAGLRIEALDLHDPHAPL